MKCHLITLLILCACGALAARTNIIVQVTEDGSQTVPPNTVALPAQVSALEAAAGDAASAAGELAGKADACETKVDLYSTNYIVTSTVYVQSVGAIAYDPSNQTMRAYSLSVTDTNVVIVGTVSQTPLVPPSIDWRQTLGASGLWSNVTASVTETDIPAGVTNAASAYRFVLPRPAGGTAFFRLVDNSTGASGSGLYWVVFGAITVDGHKGSTGIITNVVGSVTNYIRKVGGIIVDSEPLGGL